MIWIIIAVIAFLVMANSPFGEAVASRIESSGPREPEKLMAERIAWLESEIDRLASEVRRLDEESDFLQKLLAERPKEDRTLPPGDHPAG